MESVRIDLRGWPQPNTIPGKQLRSGSAESRQSELLCLKGSAQSFQCSVEKTSLKQNCSSCNIWHLYHAKGQEVKTWLANSRRQLDLADLPEHMFFRSLLNLSWELRLWKRTAYWVTHAGHWISPQPHQDFGHYDPIFMGLKRKRNLAKFSKSPNIPTARNTWAETLNPVCLAWKPTCCLRCCLGESETGYIMSRFDQNFMKCICFVCLKNPRGWLQHLLDGMWPQMVHGYLSQELLNITDSVLRRNSLSTLGLQALDCVGTPARTNSHSVPSTCSHTQMHIFSHSPTRLPLSHNTLLSTLPSNKGRFVLWKHQFRGKTKLWREWQKEVLKQINSW